MKHAVMYLIVAVAFLHSIYASSLTQGENYGLIAPLRFMNERDGSEKEGARKVNCTGVSGSICSENDCQSIYICIPGNSPIEGKCSNGQTCNKGMCSTTPSTICEFEGLNFKCSSEGVFPEPSSCKKYNYCTSASADPIQKTCPDGWAYNAANTLCDKKLPANMMCDDANREIPRCITPGQNAALKSSASYYYICLPYPESSDQKLYPSIYRCPVNQKYAGDYICK